MSINLISIFNTKIVRDLLKQGFYIVDIKPNPQNKDRTVFMFEETDEIKNYLFKKWNVKFDN